MSSFLQKWKGFFTDTVWSAAALLLMNVVLQFLVFPLFSRRMGDEQYGNFLYLISLVNIAAASIGGSTNSARLKASVYGETENGDYNIILLGASILIILPAALIARFGGVSMGVGEGILFWLLICATIFRSYSDVTFRLELNYHRYFYFYLFISSGYLLGFFLFILTGYWTLTMLMGEIFGILYAAAKSNLYRERPLVPSAQFHRMLSSFIYLAFSSFLANMVYNSDRTILKILINGTAVTIYYLASLAGKTVSLVVAPLNIVVIGHLAKYKGSLTKKLVLQICCVLIVAAVVGTFACMVISYIFVYLIYPQNWESVRPYIFIATLPQLVYFSSSVFSTFLLRFGKEKYQLAVNVVFLIALICFALPMAKTWGITGFSIGFLIATVMRFSAILYVTLKVSKEEDIKG